MPLLLLSAGSYDAIRKSLDLGLDEKALPDEVIEYPIYGPAAEADVTAADPLALTYAEGTVAKERCIRAAIFLTAARLAPSLPAIMQEAIGDYRLQQQPPDLALLARTLRGLAQAELAQNMTGGSA